MLLTDGRGKGGSYSGFSFGPEAPSLVTSDLYEEFLAVCTILLRIFNAAKVYDVSTGMDINH